MSITVKYEVEKTHMHKVFTWINTEKKLYLRTDLRVFSVTWRKSSFHFAASSAMATTAAKHQLGEKGKATGRVSGPAWKEKV